MDAKVNKTLTITTPSDLEIAMTRVFDAPRHLVFDAMTQPQHVRRWFGCAEFDLPVCEIDLRVGGAYRFVNQRRISGHFDFHGTRRQDHADDHHPAQDQGKPRRPSQFGHRNWSCPGLRPACRGSCDDGVIGRSI
jgi:Activator of Hsp90 ATPase homolog 1-like protein